MSPDSSAGEPEYRRPFVVIIDDEDQQDFAELIMDKEVDAVALAPDEVESGTLSQATVVVLDQYLDVWPGRDDRELPPAMHVPDGLALAAVLRSHVERSAFKHSSVPQPIAFVLRTGELDKLGIGMPKGARGHLLARQYNLEWVFSKEGSPSSDLPSPASRIAELAQAASLLPARWKADSRDPGLGWLGLPDVAWAEDAKWQIEQCRPPQHVVAERTAGMAWLRWFLHRILPFPTFLIDSTHLAASLGIDYPSVRQVIEGDTPLSARLDEVRYRGPLAGFLGLRWWRAGVSLMAEELRDIGEGDGRNDIQAVAKGAMELHGERLSAMDVEDPVIGVRSDYSYIPYPLSASDSVRLQPDDWPPYADDAWAARESLQSEDADPELKALVVSTDRWRLRSNPGGDGSSGRIVDSLLDRDGEDSGEL